MKTLYFNLLVFYIKHYGWINIVCFISISCLVQNLSEIALCEPDRPWMNKSPLEIMNENTGKMLQKLSLL